MRNRAIQCHHDSMRKSWLWFLITVVGYVVGQLVGYGVSAALGYNDANYDTITVAHRWLIVLAVAPFMLIPSAKMYLSARSEAEQGMSRTPMFIAGAIFIFLFAIMIVSALGLSA